MTSNKIEKYFDSIEELIDTMINYKEEENNKIFDYIVSYDFNEQISKMIKINVENIEEMEIDIDDYIFGGLYFTKILKITSNQVIVVCDMNISLVGDLSCLDYEKSYCSDDGEYYYKEYKRRKFHRYICQIIVEIDVKNGECINAKIVDLPEIDIDYESFMSVEDYMKLEKSN